MHTVEQAAEWSRWMIAKEANGSGDIGSAMRRLEMKTGIPYSVLWSLRYRPPTDIMAGVYLRIQAAHDDMRARQERAFKHETEITDVRSRASKALARAAAALARQKD